MVKTNCKNLANYKPDSAPISLHDDFTAEQLPAAQLVDKIVSALHKKKVQVASAGLFVHHDKCNYKPEDPHVQELMQQHGIVIVQEPRCPLELLLPLLPLFPRWFFVLFIIIVLVSLNNYNYSWNLFLIYWLR